MLALRSQAPGSPGQAGRDDGLLSPPWKEDARNGCSSWERHERVSPRAASQGRRGTEAAGRGEHKGPTEQSQAGVRHGRGPLACGAQRRAAEKPSGEGT